MAIVPTRTWFRVELAHAKAVWPEIKTTPEFSVGLGLFVAVAAGLGVLWLASKFR